MAGQIFTCAELNFSPCLAFAKKTSNATAQIGSEMKYNRAKNMYFPFMIRQNDEEAKKKRDTEEKNKRQNFSHGEIVMYAWR